MLNELEKPVPWFRIPLSPPTNSGYGAASAIEFRAELPRFGRISRWRIWGGQPRIVLPTNRRWNFSPELRTIVGGILLRDWSKSRLLCRGYFESLSNNQNRARTICSAACFEIHTRQAHNLKVIGSNPTPATSFVITHSPSRSDRRDYLEFSQGEGGRPRWFGYAWDYPMPFPRDGWQCLPETRVTQWAFARRAKMPWPAINCTANIDRYGFADVVQYRYQQKYRH